MNHSMYPTHNSASNTMAEQRRVFYSLPTKALWQMRVKSFLSSFTIFIMLAVLLFVLNFIVEDTFLIKLLAVGLFILWLIILVVNYILSQLEYDYTAFHLGSNGLIIRKGMLWRSEIFVLRSRVQHIDVTQDPLSRLFGLATIKVYTAGTKLGSISLSGLEHDTAESIRNQLITQATDTL